MTRTARPLDRRNLTPALAAKQCAWKSAAALRAFDQRLGVGATPLLCAAVCAATRSLSLLTTGVKRVQVNIKTLSAAHTRGQNRSNDPVCVDPFHDGALLWLLAHVPLVSSNPVMRYGLLRLIERDVPVAHHVVQVDFQPVFYFAIPKEGIFRLRPQIANVI